MPIVIYLFKLSAPCPAVLLTVKQLGLDYTVKEMNTGKNERYDPEFVKVSLNQMILCGKLVLMISS